MVAVKITMIRNINYYRPGELFLCSDPGWTAGLSGSRDDTIDTGWWVNNDVQREPLWRVCVRTPRVRRYKLHAAQVKLILRNFTSDPGSPARSIRPPSSKHRCFRIRSKIGSTSLSRPRTPERYSKYSILGW